MQHILKTETDHLQQNAKVPDFVPILPIKRKNGRRAMQGRRRAAWAKSKILGLGADLGKHRFATTLLPGQAKL